ncbi:conserved hypothetical protein [Methylobacterium sp. 4-46]|uniref:hypothetical protein n=1 Tax=unclassified Methylobacterium TaxID=2615210 RepID=UPI000165C5F9|nr:MULTISPECIES: hypothetical protein [Methylobacterium]ACA17395.1 conserved hypothetical protein [Methylobacterium sp. 4-46]WFT83081.1 hypothetical protein QA634_15140 [Methylobacterium nodulans]
MSHKFKLHQQVRMLRSGFSDSLASSGEVFEVVQLMPEDRTGEATYRIRSRMGERAVRESEIAAAAR